MNDNVYEAYKRGKKDGITYFMNEFRKAILNEQIIGYKFFFNKEKIIAIDGKGFRKLMNSMIKEFELEGWKVIDD